MSTKSKAKRDRKRKEEQRKRNQASPSPQRHVGWEDVPRLTKQMFEPLTTPEELTEQVLTFAAELGTDTPVYLGCQPELWSRQSMCNMNVVKFIELHGGEMLCGYRVWYTHPIYIEGERHAVWIKDGEIRDVSFSDTGETRILFFPDAHSPTVARKAFNDAPKKIRRAFSATHQRALKLHEEWESSQFTREMPDAQAWSTMLTYEQWLSGQRMKNLILA